MSSRHLDVMDDQRPFLSESHRTGCDGCVAERYTRRGFVSAATAALIAAAVTACGGDGDGVVGPGPNGGGTTSGVTVNGNIVTVDLAQQPGLAATNGFLFIREASTIVVNAGSDVFRAFTSVCTHEGGSVSGLVNGALECPSHGSRFSMANGAVQRGPASRPLPQFGAAFNSATNQVTIIRG